MGPIALTIVTAIGLGAAKGLGQVTGDAIVDAYAAVKAIIKRKFSEGDMADAVEGVEKKPDSTARQAVLVEEVEAAQAEADEELMQAITALQAAMEKEKPNETKQIQIQVTGNFNAVASDNSAASVNVNWPGKG